MDTKNEIVTEFQKLGDTMIETTAELRSRVEMLEANADRPRSTDDEHFAGFLPSGEKALILPSTTRARPRLAGRCSG